MLAILFCLLLSTACSAEITLCPPPVGDKRGWLFLITDLQAALQATPWSALLSISLPSPITPAPLAVPPIADAPNWYDKTCGYRACLPISQTLIAIYCPPPPSYH